MKFLICIALGVLASGCVITPGKLEIKGSVIDEDTGELLPGREIIIEGLKETGDELITVYAGQLTTGTSGTFNYRLKRIEDARYYNFHVVGDTNYAAYTRKLNIFQLRTNSKRILFPIRRLAGLTIKIEKMTDTPGQDTLYLSWESDRINFRNLYPYEIENQGITDIPVMVIPGMGLRWIGGDINSTVRTRVYADRITRLRWELARNKRRSNFTDTITCRRDLAHTVHFTY